jgi:carbonic anhydrase
VQSPFQVGQDRERAFQLPPVGREGRRVSHTLFITCSDLRVDPYRLTGSSPGQLYVLSNAGNIVPPHGAEIDGQSAAITAALDNPKVRDVIVCGHSPCLVMQALLSPDLMSSLPAMTGWLGHAAAARSDILGSYGQIGDGRGQFGTAAKNVLTQLDNLRTIPIIAARVAVGDLRLHGWVYDLEAGVAFRHDPAKGRFVRGTAEPT